jgi:hypothetical protein
MELSQDSPAPDVPLRDEIAEVIYGTSQGSVERPWDPEWTTPSDLPVVNDAFDTADVIMNLLTERGHVVPGVPPLLKVLADFKVTHDRLTLTMLALRTLNMLTFTEVRTPESKPARQFIDDYLLGKNHGPAGEPMLWPGRLPGLASLFREWGFMPTIAFPGQPSFVARAAQEIVPS